MVKQQGQVVIILTLVMLVALAIGIAISQRSITSVSISNKTEQSSRAFSAAEAGIQQALSNPAALSQASSQLSIGSSQLGNESKAQVISTGLLPIYRQPLEYPPLSKADFAQFWLAKPTDLTPYYTKPTVTLYFGNANTNYSQLDTNDLPAVEINLVTKLANGTFTSTRSYYDAAFIGSSSRQPASGFSAPTQCNGLLSINTSNSIDGHATDRKFQCKVVVNTKPNSLDETPILIRVRVFFSNKKQLVALAPDASGCAAYDLSCSLPPQASIYTSTGFSGETQRRLQVFQESSVVPQFLDFAIFSNGTIQK